MTKIIKFRKYLKDEKRIIMCPPIRRIQGKTAYELLNEFGNPNEVPINLKYILNNIGISVLPMDFTDLETKINKGHILGLVLSDDENAVIYYSSHDTPHRQQFTIAHELGHICKHLRLDTTDYPYIDWRIDGDCDSENEKAANIFAGELLIPIHLLKEVYLSMKFPSSKDLANIFGTSINVMEERLNYLHVSYYNRNGRAVVNTYGE